ncbi:hypothetical protein [Rhodococcus sp. AH-ZY2]|uniref:hypothetical protein n=1 Tax=Rhodococcus sp. AH-ZY2 TaxID=3047468 RepID=UPI0027DEEABA|nr:hypothetical protein [Rhodococcus sp. AH-ZY2]WML64766.1 hypothetical protein QNA09_08240 [Rhodococcus sp. AH-ZY2]
MSYFGDEPTCTRCDYPERLHHLLRVDHNFVGPDKDARNQTPGVDNVARHGLFGAVTEKHGEA